MKPLPRMTSFRGALAVVSFGVALALILIFNAAGMQDDTTADPATRPAAAEPGELIDGERGLKYRVVATAPEGRKAQTGDVVMVHYTGKLDDGTVFDTSRQVRRGQREAFPVPITLRLGDGMVIPGWEIGLTGMEVGEKRVLIIPPDLAYGEAGAGGVIPPNATLTFDVELVGLARPE
ncbi:MAG: FKBP-type peptidyl-prolyl cis-trans isomerase [Planctomycetota bacterium]